MEAQPERFTNHKGQSLHQAQGPEKLYFDLMKPLLPGKVVLDPYAGTGTVGAVCRDQGRPCILIEINYKYCQLIRKRLARQTIYGMSYAIKRST